MPRAPLPQPGRRWRRPGAVLAPPPPEEIPADADSRPQAPGRRRAAAILALCLLGATAARADEAAVKELAPGLLEGYLERGALPDSLALVPPAPAFGSPRMALDEAVSAASLALQATPRFAQATKDANLHFPAAAQAFSCALGLAIDPAATPNLYHLLRRSLTDAGLSTYTAKNHYDRARPFTVNGAPTCTPDDEPALRKDGSYPSGHTAIGWAWALILTEVAPERTDALLQRGLAFGESRIVCNVHWQQDVTEGRIVGAAAVARLQADAVFQQDLEAATAEYQQARDAGLPALDCAAEQEALSYRLD